MLPLLMLRSLLRLLFPVPAPRLQPIPVPVRVGLLLLLVAMPAQAQVFEPAPEVAAPTLYRRSGLGFEYARRDYNEGDHGTGFTVLFSAEPLAYSTPVGKGVNLGGLLGGAIGFGAVRRQLPGDTLTRAYVLRRFEATALAGLDVPVGRDLQAGLFVGYSAQGLLTTFERSGPLVRLRLNTVPVRLEGNALLTGKPEGSVTLLVPLPTGTLLRGKVAFGFHASRYETARSGVAKLFGFSINAMDF